jgi:hypothetical protein
MDSASSSPASSRRTKSKGRSSASNTDQPSSTATARSAPSLYIRVERLKRVPDFAYEFQRNLTTYENTHHARKFRKKLEAGEFGIPDTDGEFHKWNSFAKIEAFIEYVRNGLYRGKIYKPLCVMSRHKTLKWAQFALEQYQPKCFFGGVEAHKFKRQVGYYNDRPKVALALLHVTTMLSANAALCKFKKTRHLYFFDFPFSVAMVKGMIDQVLVYTHQPKLEVVLFCMENSLDEVACKLLERKLIEAYSHR